MKIGIMTFWWSNDNYGQLLQCYALQKYLRDAGHDAYLIRYSITNDYTPLPPKPVWKRVFNVFNPIKLFNYIRSRIKNKMRTIAIVQEQGKNKNRDFDGFRSKYVVQSQNLYNYYAELKENPPQADIYIVGSDQIWNPDCLLSPKIQSKAYFLDFGNSSVKRMSYAASFGKENLEDDFAETITPLLQNFDYVSVREKTGVNICKQCGINNAEWVIDPTMLLEQDVYRALYKEDTFKKPTKPYVFFYFLANGSDFSVKEFYAWTKSKNLDVVYISANSQFDKYEKTYATIPEWIYLIEHAEFVVTNSFHSCVFSLIFEKNFGVVPLLGRSAGMNSRMESLFELFSIDKRYVYSCDFSVLDKKIDWKTVVERLNNLRSNNRLLKIINGMGKANA